MSQFTSYTSTNVQKAYSPTSTSQQQNYDFYNTISEIESAILQEKNPLNFNETEVITAGGYTGVWTNKNEVAKWQHAGLDLNSYEICNDPNPTVIRKAPETAINYTQEVNIRYLRPPTPPPPGDLIIVEAPPVLTPAAPPLVIRQQQPRPETPPPLVIREAPPTPPLQIQTRVITVHGKRLPPPPRKVVVERLAQLPPKPQPIIIERWLQYKEQKRRVLYVKNPEPDPVVVKPKNVIIQWDPPRVQIQKTYKDLGVIRANPNDYTQRYGNVMLSPQQLPQFVKDIQPPEGLMLAYQYKEYKGNCAYYNTLEGDVDMLKLVDLDKFDLGYFHYRVHKNDKPEPVEPIIYHPPM